MFGNMVDTSLWLIQDEEQKELFKLNLQTIIYNVSFRKGLQQNNFPHNASLQCNVFTYLFISHIICMT